MKISPQGRQVSVIRGLGLSITALKSRGRPQPTSTVDSLPTVEERVTCRNTSPALQGSQHELLACDNTRNKLEFSCSNVCRENGTIKVLFESCQDDNIQFEKERANESRKWSRYRLSKVQHRKLKRQDIRPALKLTLLREVQFCTSSLKTCVCKEVTCSHSHHKIRKTVRNTASEILSLTTAWLAYSISSYSAILAIFSQSSQQIPPTQDSTHIIQGQDP